MLYLETSLLAAAFTSEPQTRRMQIWLGEQDPAQLLISVWVATEFSAYLAMKLRAGWIDPAQRAAILTLFKQMMADSLTVLPVTGAHFQAAGRLADDYASALRAGDAMHLAVAADCGATLCTLDRRLAHCAEAVGVPVQVL